MGGWGWLFLSPSSSSPPPHHSRKVATRTNQEHSHTIYNYCMVLHVCTFNRVYFKPSVRLSKTDHNQTQRLWDCIALYMYSRKKDTATEVPVTVGLTFWASTYAHGILCAANVFVIQVEKTFKKKKKKNKTQHVQVNTADVRLEFAELNITTINLAKTEQMTVFYYSTINTPTLTCDHYKF